VETHFLRNEVKEKWIEDYDDRETAVGRQWVKDTQTAIEQEQEDTRKAEDEVLTNREPKDMFQEMMVTLRCSMNDLASSDDVEDADDKNDEDAEPGKLSKDDQPSWVMGTISKTILQHMERFW